MDLFYADKKRKDGKYPYCKSCNKIRSGEADAARKRRWRLENPERFKKTQRRSVLKLKYGLSEFDYDLMVSEQDGLCVICEEIPSNGFMVDHDHETGYVRGLLCTRCNALLGFARDDCDVLRRARIYLVHAELIQQKELLNG